LYFPLAPRAGRGQGEGEYSLSLRERARVRGKYPNPVFTPHSQKN